ncbi:uncharacterized protein RHOBADRAFT_64747 [Rhodotorula graminis WP1]|uniref:t-SNARE coiled-coil homology domain-containing protein n=1 Tax=Rhodotorula graminis (strain WP1) TaxID=578459 RepID=A0A194S752_RHOGW|nr:uncharacterized protein RHOBADRAFT_64747 [Rhodotorula graminis WP1]KPV76417.1 hypothetical protein RHOBADRAFT_64747 [Rhodotorula graminis WP1]
MDSSVFVEYETDLVTVLKSVGDKIASEAHSLRGDERKTLLSRLGRELDEADEIIEQMQLEAQTADKDDKVEFQGKLRNHRATLARHKGEIKALATSADRDALLATPSSSAPRGDHVALEMDSRSGSPSFAQAQRLLSATDKLADGQRRLEESHRVALETEDLGTGILRDLRGQRETLEHTRDTLYEADGSIDRAAGTLKKMMRRASQQRLVTYAILALLVLHSLYVLASKLFG